MFRYRRLIAHSDLLGVWRPLGRMRLVAFLPLLALVTPLAVAAAFSVPPGGARLGDAVVAFLTFEAGPLLLAVMLWRPWCAVSTDVLYVAGYFTLKRIPLGDITCIAATWTGAQVELANSRLVSVVALQKGLLATWLPVITRSDEAAFTIKELAAAHGADVRLLGYRNPNRSRGRNGSRAA